MKMAKPSARDIEAAEELHQVLQMIDARFGGPFQNHEAGDDLATLLDNGDSGVNAFDSDNEQHLLTLYNHLARLLRNAPNFYGRVIGGMCWVIMNEANQILDPDADVIDLHPRFQQMADRLNALEAKIAAGTLREVPDGYVLMPQALTAENGAKGLLLGEFHIDSERTCDQCEIDEPDENCEVCRGETEYTQRIPVPWDTIKEIYAKAAAGLAIRTEAPQP
ncbi:hypothetical protein [Ectopseudomonas mendocina]|uniref:Uncharacterized protein n=1 Tax=Ectopseudomonas mendocina TaxID=300 RepID=A0A2R3QHL8_ECTME|nr:hypothetical protein [Pseudomonas mendocina]AVO51244.1 hypothetical protein C7A17_00150 [Pseudomonas mendocina]